MRLSEAIRLGSMLKPQGVGAFYSRSDASTCALGAALDAVGEIRGEHVLCDEGREVLRRFWPIVDCEVPPLTADGNPLTTGLTFPVWRTVQMMNDAHRWSRERIADWVESIERTHEPQSPAAGEAGSTGSDSLVSDAEVLITVSI